MLYKGAFKYYVSTFGGVGGLSQKVDILTLFRVEVAELKHRARIAVQYLKLSIN